MTWHSFSVLTYLLAMLGVAAGVILCFALSAFGIGIEVRNSYIAFLIFLAAHAAIIAIAVQIPQSWPGGLAMKYLAVLTPVGLWLKHGLWFTDGDVDIAWAHFEMLGLGVSLCAMAVFCLLSAIRFRKRDLT